MITAARLILAALVLGSIVFALYQHGRWIPGRKYHAAVHLGAVAVEVVLIWAAGGWG